MSEPSRFLSYGQLLLCTALLLTATPMGASPLTAQNPDQTRDAGGSRSLWWGVSVGGGGTRLTCDICQPKRDLGPSANVSVGAHASENLRVGVEGGGWSHDDDGEREKVYRVGVVAQLSPLVGRGLYLLGGFGWSGYRAGGFRYDAPRISVGAGWDLPVTGSWIIGSQLVLDASSFGSLKNEEDIVARRVGLSTIRLSIHLRQS